MKQIFEWLRKQMQNRIAYNESCHEEFKDSKMALIYEVQQNAWKNALAIVDEAEAKWEADCCTWKKNIYFFGGHDYSSGCGTRIPLNSLEYHKYCPFCGKPIKISEVE